MAVSLPRPPLVRVALLTTAVLGFCVFYNVLNVLLGFGPAQKVLGNVVGSAYFPDKAELGDLRMGEKQCHTTFPGLFKEIDDAVARGPFQLERAADDYTGLVQGRIKNGKLYVISSEKKPSRDMLFERNAVLHALHRALITSPSPLPDTIFTFTILDSPRNNSWSFSRTNDPTIISDGNYWVMPHFSFWSWPKPFIGPIDQALSRIANVEATTPWEQKTDKAVWRGTAWFNSVGNVNLRPKLLEITKGKDWADVQDMKWVTNGEAAHNSIEIEDFCKYKYLIYTEGITYSGRLPFHQACESVLLTPPPNYLLHTTHLVRPVLSSTILRPNDPVAPNLRWLNTYPASKANVIFLDPDWNDLEPIIMWLREHPEIAKGIAKRQRDDFKRGYLSEAAEVCYWRALVRGWSSVARLDDVRWTEKGGEGVRWETFALLQHDQ